MVGGGWEGAEEGYQATPARLRSWAFFCKHCEAKMRFEEGHEVTGAMHGCWLGQRTRRCRDELGMTS